MLEFKFVSRKGFTCYSVTNLDSEDRPTLLIFERGYGYQLHTAYVVPDSVAEAMNADRDSACYTKRYSPIFGLCYSEECFSVFNSQAKILENFAKVAATNDISKIRGFVFSLFFNHFGR